MIFSKERSFKNKKDSLWTDPKKLDRKNLTFGVSTKAFLLYKEYQIV